MGTGAGRGAGRDNTESLGDDSGLIDLSALLKQADDDAAPSTAGAGDSLAAVACTDEAESADERRRLVAGLSIAPTTLNALSSEAAADTPEPAPHRFRLIASCTITGILVLAATMGVRLVSDALSVQDSSEFARPSSIATTASPISIAAPGAPIVNAGAVAPHTNTDEDTTAASPSGDHHSPTVVGAPPHEATLANSVAAAAAAAATATATAAATATGAPAEDPALAAAIREDEASKASPAPTGDAPPSTMTADAPPTAPTDASEGAAEKAVADKLEAAKRAAAPEADDLGGAMQKAVGARRDEGPSSPQAGKPANAPLQPAPGIVVSAVRAVLPSARACLPPQSPARNVELVFKSDGHIARVNLGAGTPEDSCLRDALSKAHVDPFLDDTFASKVTIRP